MMSQNESDLVLGYREENELLRVHLKQLQTELEKSAFKLLEEANKRKAVEAEYEQRLKELRKEFEETEHETRQVKEQLWHARRELHSIRQSKSWKVTYPLRVVTSLASRMRKG